VNNPDNCKSSVPATVLIPDVYFAALLTVNYPGAMYNGNRMDTANSLIKNEKVLDVSGNGIADLFGVQFFVSLQTLNCSDNLLTALPYLPASVKEMNCEKNSFVDLPAVLPLGLNILHCGFNQLKTLPALPSGLDELDCNNNKIVCFEKFADGITAINISGNSNKCLPNYINAMDAATKLIPLCITGDKANNPDDCPGKPMVGVNRVTSGTADLVVYPNPGNGVFKLEFPVNMRGNELKIEVYNILGELVATCSVNDTIGVVDLSSQSMGYTC
jgi:hypothetical protein